MLLIDFRVLDVNADVIDNLRIVYLDPYRRGWILDLEPCDPKKVRERNGGRVQGETSF